MTKKSSETNQEKQTAMPKETEKERPLDAANNIQNNSKDYTEQASPEEKATKEDDFQALAAEKVSSDDKKNELEQEITGLKMLNQELESKIRIENDRYVRLLAEFDNFKKRNRQELETRAKFSHQPFAEELIACLDDLEIAIKHMSKDELLQKSGAISGLQMALNKFLAMLSNFGIEKICAEQQAFDPTIHEAVGVVDGTEENDNSVQTELQTGYRIHDKILRPAKVIVAKKK